MPFRALARYMTAAVVVALLIAALPYVYYLGEFGVSKDHQAWASFGGYFGGVLGPLLAFANLLAVAWIGTVVVTRQQEQVIRKQLTLDMLNEYHADPLHKSRVALDELIEKAERHSGALPSLSEFERTDPTNSPNAFRLYQFFEKWAVLARTGNVDNDLLLAALGGRVSWWKEKFFDRIAARESDPHIRESLKQIEAHVLTKAKRT
ncbi:MAG: hypothetical protein C4K60_15405 [Ideonella sp. MAG2]|nr:MAG: hypothetical protein C4K60_15405 [Ideonella sp. MAG2]